MADSEPVTEMLKPIELAGCLPIDDQGRILLIHRKTDDKDQIETIGGKTEEGENEKETAQREFGEEIEGSEFEIGGKIGDLRFYENGVEHLYHLFSGRILSGIPKPKEAKHIKVKWWTLEELHKTNLILSNNVRALLDAVALGEIELLHQSS